MQGSGSAGEPAFGPEPIYMFFGAVFCVSLCCGVAIYNWEPQQNQLLKAKEETVVPGAAQAVLRENAPIYVITAVSNIICWGLSASVLPFSVATTSGSCNPAGARPFLDF